MTTIAIIGAGPGLGAAVARRFGAEGFAVALIARDQGRLDALTAELNGRITTIGGYAADVRDPAALTAALGRAAGELGPVEVLQYSPLPHHDFLRPLPETTTADITAAVEFSVLGPVTAVQAVLPGMRALGRGTVLFVNGGSATRPNPAVAGTSIAFAAETAYATMLHDTLAPDGIHVAQLIVPGAITADHPDKNPAALADRLWRIHTTRAGFRTYAEPMPEPR
ncbi:MULTISPECIES: SDR family NAD(P)-dependent oxidoreductase [Catenuloplanes]|uniref:NADP-dependent 3-hydroxy acid dehydrogenase YdfG n=1 Tax=Catenuloplanes niger TaxID=587534 RepID=A0AAE4CYD2_9ACTN|nr:SDR family NAD(P)-dependent oxidoreductase [Catenuloplanes niger]MDR7327448.1 NADP-dependent 3-hydroxy acid dehydrogenase YdfG [Catenuloplanes niger]